LLPQSAQDYCKYSKHQKERIFLLVASPSAKHGCTESKIGNNGNESRKHDNNRTYKHVFITNMGELVRKHPFKFGFGKKRKKTLLSLQLLRDLYFVLLQKHLVLDHQ
jgi:hypothetical protein